MNNLKLKRAALIIGNPGIEGQEGYLAGVQKDLANYRNFLRSDIGGAWENDEIETLILPSRIELNAHLRLISDSDYVVIIFSGHGYYDKKLNSTVIQLNPTNNISLIDLKKVDTKLTLILDCCRRIHEETILEKTAVYAADSMPKIFNREECRRYYDKQIVAADKHIETILSCGIDEFSNDNSRTGGVFSFNFLRSAREWAQNGTFDTSKTYFYLSISTLLSRCKAAVMRETNNEQEPEVQIPKVDNLYPFCIVSK